MIGKIEITGASPSAIVRAAYSPSTPRGLGHFHFQPGDLTDDEIIEIIARTGSSRQVVSMDYVKGRSIKMRVTKDAEGRAWIRNRWYDHGDGDLRNFLRAIGVPEERLDASRAEEDAHITACVAAAVAFLEEKGGSYSVPRLAEPTDLPPLVWDGLFYGIDRKRTHVEYSTGDDLWTLLTSPNFQPEDKP